MNSAIRKSTHDLLMEVMYAMFKTGTLPEGLDMEDYECMWLALINHWNINISVYGYDLFIEEVNSMASDRKEVFETVFNKYFNI